MCHLSFELFISKEKNKNMLIIPVLVLVKWIRNCIGELGAPLQCD